MLSPRQHRDRRLHVLGGGIDRHLREVALAPHHRLVARRREAEFPCGHGLQAVLVARVPQVVRQQGVHHHAGERQTMAQQDQS
ncbi:MAG: hypothetical protein ACK55I_37260, partial [bacterium]